MRLTDKLPKALDVVADICLIIMTVLLVVIMYRI